MAAIVLNSKEEFKHTILQGISIIDFNALWCGPCRAQEPIMDALSDIYAGKAVVAKLNIDENQLVAMDIGIQSIPTIVIFKDGHEIHRFIGWQPVETLDQAIKCILA